MRERRAVVDKKRELILKTYGLLKTTSPKDLKIRTIADECGCASTVIYRNFDDLDHLILFASVKFLENYIIDIKEIVNEQSDPMEMLTTMWQVFAEYAFQTVDVFELLFWGKYKERLGDTIFEYYQIFPAEMKQLDGLFTSVFFNSDIRERTYMIMHRAAVVGYFMYDDVRMLSDMQVHLFYGLLKSYQPVYRQEGKAEEAAGYYMQMLDALISRFRLR